MNLGWNDKAEIHLEPVEDRTMRGGKEIACLTMFLRGLDVKEDRETDQYLEGTLTLAYWDCSEKAMAPHSSTLAWKIPWMEEPGRLQSMGSLGVGHD